MFPFRKSQELPTYDITDDVNEVVHSGVQEKPQGEPIVIKEQDLAEHVQTIFEDSDPAEAREILSIAIKTAKENQEPYAYVTCENDNEACAAIRESLRIDPSIKGYEETPKGREITFTIEV
jgi:hypothetical protein